MANNSPVEHQSKANFCGAKEAAIRPFAQRMNWEEVMAKEIRFPTNLPLAWAKGPPDCFGRREVRDGCEWEREMGGRGNQELLAAAGATFLSYSGRCGKCQLLLLLFLSTGQGQWPSRRPGTFCSLQFIQFSAPAAPCPAPVSLVYLFVCSRHCSPLNNFGAKKRGQCSCRTTHNI